MTPPPRTATATLARWKNSPACLTTQPAEVSGPDRRGAHDPGPAITRPALRAPALTRSSCRELSVMLSGKGPVRRACRGQRRRRGVGHVSREAAVARRPLRQRGPSRTQSVLPAGFSFHVSNGTAQLFLEPYGPDHLLMREGRAVRMGITRRYTDAGGQPRQCRAADAAPLPARSTPAVIIRAGLAGVPSSNAHLSQPPGSQARCPPVRRSKSWLSWGFAASD